MRFDSVRDPAKIARIQKRLADREAQLMTSRGPLVRYEMPALPNAFPQLARILESSAHRTQFSGIHHHIESKEGRIEEESLVDRLHQCVVPVRLLVGTVPHPAEVPREQRELLRASLPDFRSDSVSRAGQYIPEEQPAVVLVAVARLDEESR
jgi:hypothetical protein